MTKRYTINKCNIKRIERVFNKLKKFLPKPYRKIQIGCVFTEHPDYKTYQGGYAVRSTINIGTEFINKYPTEIAIAEMIGHELGHQVLGHLNIYDRGIEPKEEQDADHFGMFLCELAGYSRTKFINHCEQFEKDRAKTLSLKHKLEHGTGQERVDRLKDQDIYLNKIDNFKDE